MTAPVYFPEFDKTFSWAMCRNSLSGNFGLHYTGETPTNENLVAHDANYRPEHKTALKCRLRCMQCGQSFEIRNNNQSVHTVARHFLSLSLPFADCPDEQCENRDRNVFEHFFDKDFDKRGSSHYERKGSEQRVSCRGCQETQMLGESLRPSVNPL